MCIEENVLRIREQIKEAALAAGRKPEEIQLCAATKMNDAQAVRRAIAAGVDCCGENRVQELTAKLKDNGHLQTNKVRQVVGKVDLIQSVDSLHLLKAIQQEAVKQNICQEILLEVNIGQELSKSGFGEGEIPEVLEQMCDFPNIFVRGLMAIPPICQNHGDNDKFFQKMYNLSVDITAKKYDNVCVTVLSMGMSDDFQQAIAMGSTMVRIGTGIFGPRNYQSPI